MTKNLILGLFIATAVHLSAELTPSYHALMRIPLDLRTADGIQLEKGMYELEVKPEKNSYVLVISAAGKVGIGNQENVLPVLKALVKPLPSQDSSGSAAHLPLVGTHYLRSSADPVLTAQERQHSKTGRAQYEEETREWKATLRMYKSTNDSAVYFVFQARGEDSRWNRVSFKLFRQDGN